MNKKGSPMKYLSFLGLLGLLGLVTENPGFYGFFGYFGFLAWARIKNDERLSLCTAKAGLYGFTVALTGMSLTIAYCAFTGNINAALAGVAIVFAASITVFAGAVTYYDHRGSV